MHMVGSALATSKGTGCDCSMGRSQEDKKKLKDAAKQGISGQEEQYEIDRHEITGKDSGEGAFPSARAPDVSKVWVDKLSDSGYVQITGGGIQDRIIRTGPTEESGASEETRFEEVDICVQQTCMIFGRSTILYARPPKPKKSKHK